MNIDWSKAPEGATHKDTSCPGGFWYKFDYELNTAAFCPPGQTEWVASGPATAYNDGSLESMVSREEGSCGQIAAEEREKTVAEMVRDSILDDGSALWFGNARKLYDAGWRK